MSLTTLLPGERIVEETPATDLNLQTEETAPVKPCTRETDIIIRNRVHGSLAIALVPVPFFNTTALAALQVEMIYQLAKAHGIPFKAEWGKQITAALVGGILPALITPKLSHLMRYVPIVGPGLSLATLPLTNAAATYAVGRAFASHFATGAGFNPLDMKKIGDEIKSGYEGSKKTVKGWFTKDEPAEVPAT